MFITLVIIPAFVTFLAFYEPKKQVLSFLQHDLKANLHLSLLDVGSCNLHIVHGCFRDSAKASGWDLDWFLSSLFWLFNDSPARREDFSNVTGCSTFPLEMCSHWWLENTIVCEWALLLLPKLKQYVAVIAAGTCAKPQNRSFEVIHESCMDNLLTAKLHFLLSVAKQIELFLVMYQTDKPIVPFLSRDLLKLVRS